MKRNSLFILLVVIITCCKQKSTTANDKETIRKTLLRYYDALKTKNFDQLREITTADYLLYEDGKSYTIDSIISSFKNFPAFTVDYNFSAIDIKTDRESSRVHFLKQADFVINDTGHIKVTHLESATLRKENGKWKMEFNHLSLKK